MAALQRQNIDIPLTSRTMLLVYEPHGRNEAILQAKKRRNAGQAVELLARDAAKTESDYTAYAERNHISEVRFL